jgi:hypothetical protein
MPAVASRTEYLTIGAVIIGTRACHAKNLPELYTENHRGGDRLIPNVAGVVAYPRQRHDVTHTLELVINGRYASDGTLNANAMAGLRANIAELKTITAPVTTGDGTRTVTWTYPGGSASAACHVGPLLIGRHFGPSVLATLDLHVPAGLFS